MLRFVMNSSQHFKDTMRYYRKTRRLTHQEMAEFIGCHRLRYTRIEQGINQPNDHEWDCFINGSRFPTHQAQLSFPDFSQAQFLLPTFMRAQAFMSSTLGHLFQQHLIHVLTQQEWVTLLNNCKIPVIYFTNLLNPYPYTLWLRMIESLKVAGHFADQKAVNHFVGHHINTKQWWGSKWGAYMALLPEERFEVCLKNWVDSSKNHEIVVRKLLNSDRSLEIKVTPKPCVPRELYFNHPVIGDFFAQWICALMSAFLLGSHYLTYQKEKQSWLITVIRG